jgi:uncharacterized protein
VPSRFRRVRLLLLVVSAVLVGALCVAAAGAIAVQPQRSTSAQATFPRGTVDIRKRHGATVRLTVELARAPQQRARGLMGRRSLPARHGMLFLFPAPTRGGFWMKNTLIPLSIAFVGADGRIVEILDMEPCRADPCRVYTPRRPYVRALEVNGGAFRRWGVRVGDRVVLLRPTP